MIKFLIPYIYIQFNFSLHIYRYIYLCNISLYVYNREIYLSIIFNYFSIHIINFYIIIQIRNLSNLSKNISNKKQLYINLNNTPSETKLKHCLKIGSTSINWLYVSYSIAHLTKLENIDQLTSSRPQVPNL